MKKGFSKLNTTDKIAALTEQHQLNSDFKQTLQSHIHPEFQDLYNQFSENTLSNFFLPYGVAPGFLINDKEYSIPMVIEESSVVAAASKAAKFWALNGGFKTRIISTNKRGQLFFTTEWTYTELTELLPKIKKFLLKVTEDITQSMRQRGGGIIDFELHHESDVDAATYCLTVSFETRDSMGANFINSCLEKMGEALKAFLKKQNSELAIEINMAILSNYTPECIVECMVSCPTPSLQAYSGTFTAEDFALRFQKAVQLATHNVGRAVTHNKGIMNGIDAVVLATGNDFRAIEAGVHAFAAKNGQYSSLTKIDISENIFTYTLTVPLAVGTVGGLTSLHPLAKQSLALLEYPNAQELMQIMAAAGMANNFSAIAALVTSGIQKGHMKMHLSNILSTFNAVGDEKEAALNYFKNKTVSHSAVKQFLEDLRKNA